MLSRSNLTRSVGSNGQAHQTAPAASEVVWTSPAIRVVESMRAHHMRGFTPSAVQFGTRRCDARKRFQTGIRTRSMSSARCSRPCSTKYARCVATCSNFAPRSNSSSRHAVCAITSPSSAPFVVASSQRRNYSTLLTASTRTLRARLSV